jgi:hypothetical protein
VKKYLKLFPLVAVLLATGAGATEIPQATSNTVVNLFATMLVLKGKCHSEFSPASFNALSMLATAAGVDLQSPQTQAQI